MALPRPSLRLCEDAAPPLEGARVIKFTDEMRADVDRDPDRKGVAIVVRVDRVMNLGNQVLQEREGAPPTPERTLNLFEDAYSTRSIRRFKPDPLPDDVLDRILETATQAPSGTN